MYLYKQWYGLHAGNLSSVYRVSGQNMKRSCAALYYFLHANAILKPGKVKKVSQTTIKQRNKAEDPLYTIEELLF